MMISGFDYLFEILKKIALERPEEPEEPEPKVKTMTLLELTEGLNLLKLASICSRTLFGMSSGQQQLDRDLSGSFLAMRRY
jgi:hypothetical protein